MEKLSKIKTIIATLGLICIFSCSQKNYFRFTDDEYRNRRTDAYQFLYVVDTIQIENPIVFLYEGHHYVCADTIVKNKIIDDALFERQDVYLYLSDFYFFMTNNDFKRIENFQKKTNEKEKAIKVKYKNKTLYTHGFDQQCVTFMLGLVNHDFYEYKVRCPDYPNKRLKIKNSQNTYVKVLTCM